MYRCFYCLMCISSGWIRRSNECANERRAAEVQFAQSVRSRRRLHVSLMGADSVGLFHGVNSSRNQVLHTSIDGSASVTINLLWNTGYVIRRRDPMRDIRFSTSGTCCARELCCCLTRCARGQPHNSILFIIVSEP